MNGLSTDTIAIDTNVFMHLLHNGEIDDSASCNKDSHIDELLTRLCLDAVKLLVDEDKRIDAEYSEYVIDAMNNRDETDGKRYILKYWMIDADRVMVAVDYSSMLFKNIRKVIHEKSEKVDQVFVYVAFASGRVLITNDSLHILWGPPSESNTKKDNRYSRLRRETKKQCKKKTIQILSSIDAHKKLDEPINDAEANESN